MDSAKILEKLSNDMSTVTAGMTDMRAELGVVSTKVDHSIEIHETICKYHESQFKTHDEQIEQLQKDQKDINQSMSASAGALKLSSWLVATVITLVGIYIAFVPK